MFSQKVMKEIDTRIIEELDKLGTEISDEAKFAAIDRVRELRDLTEEPPRWWRDGLLKALAAEIVTAQAKVDNLGKDPSEEAIRQMFESYLKRY